MSERSKPGPAPKYTGQPCTVEECDQPAKKRDMCTKHYQRWIKRGTTDLPTEPAPARLCAEDGCERKHYGRGLCRMHLARVQRAEAMARRPPRPKREVPVVLCSEDGCDLPKHARDRCQNHYKQWKRRQRGLEAPGPKPEPSKPRSRYNPTSGRNQADMNVLKENGKSFATETHCANGHEWNEDTRYVDPRGRHACRACTSEAVKRWQKRNPEKVRAIHRMNRYGLTQEDFDQLFIQQEGQCAICSRAFTADVPPQVDHCHTTGRVRGLLCKPCNIALGHAKDDPELLQRAAAYVTGA